VQGKTLARDPRLRENAEVKVREFHIAAEFATEQLNDPVADAHFGGTFLRKCDAHCYGCSKRKSGHNSANSFCGFPQIHG
jgi:hypothetical protein